MDGRSLTSFFHKQAKMSRPTTLWRNAYADDELVATFAIAIMTSFCDFL